VILKMADLWQADSTAMPNASQESLSAQGLSENWLEKARHIVSIVETVGQGLDTLQREARLTGVRFKRTPALKQLSGNLTPRVGLTSYYKYRRLYQEYAGDLSLPPSSGVNGCPIYSTKGSKRHGCTEAEICGCV
jgi:hypothetical protein